MGSSHSKAESKVESKVVSKVEPPCQKCKNLDISKVNEAGGDGLLELEFDLEDFVETCKFCAFLKTVGVHFHGADFGECDNLEVRTRRQEPIFIDYYHNGAEAKEAAISCQIAVYSERKCRSIPELGVSVACPIRVDVPDAARFIVDCLLNCLGDPQHSACQESLSQVGPLPTRVLSVGSEAEPIRLIETAKLGAKTARYLTLSYCWGQKQPLTTTPVTLKERLQAISLDDLPAVFQQAVLITRAMRLEYLWIDALCIIQDDQQDWEREASRMCEYYENSYVNLAVACSADATVPFLGERPPLWQPQRFNMVNTSGKYDEIIAQRIPKPFYSGDDGLLFSRGWTLQESMLANRTIYFTHCDLSWQCRSNKSVWQHLSSSTPPANPVLQLNGNFKGMLQMIEAEPPGTERHAALLRYCCSLWRVLVSEYTRRRLSHEADKLPALSGLAAKLAVVTGKRYIAGLWEADTPGNNFSWYRDFRRFPDPQPPQFLAPSCSWASVRGSVVFGGNRLGVEEDNRLADGSVTTELLDAHCEVPGLNPFGAVSGGFIRLKGRVAFLDIHSPDPKQRFHSCKAWGPAGEACTFHPDTTLIVADGRLRRAKEGEVLAPFRAKALCIHLKSGNTKGSRKHTAMVLGLPRAEDGSMARIGLIFTSADELFTNASLQEVMIV